MTLEKAKELLRGLNTEETAIIQNTDLSKLDISGIADFELKRRAEWLAKQNAPKRYSITENGTSVTFKRIA